MIRLVSFELEKVWQRRSFLLSMCVLLAVNVFLLWYGNLPDDETPPSGAYRAFSEDVRTMTVEEKGAYLTEWKEKTDGVVFVQNVQNLLANGGSMGAELARQEMADHGELFEKYYDLYQSGDYLLYTESLSQETALVNELFDAYQKVAAFPKYLDSIVTEKNILDGISVFGASNDNFSSRNIGKSARDYAALADVKTDWQVDQGITIAAENEITDLLLFLATVLFVGSLITEEKEKGLFYITRATKNGRSILICGKLGALMIHCATVVVLMLGTNLLFALASTGTGDLSVSLQSLAPYVQSVLPISVLEYLLLSAVTKTLLLFVFGAVIVTTAIISSHSFFSYMVGFGVLGISFAAYTFIPAVSVWAPVKYLNLWGAMRTEFVYGEYLNLNCFGYPVTLATACIFLLCPACVITAAGCIAAFLRGSVFTVRKAVFQLPSGFHPHGSLLRHESYKLLIANRGLLVLLCFALLLGCQGINRQYYVSGQEQYYQGLMLRLEGELTEEKTELIQSEQERFDEATAQIARIDALTEGGSIDCHTADLMKQEWEAVLSCYPAFARVLAQYENVRKGGSFVYDTGYLYLLGKEDNSFSICLLLLSICMVLAFYNSISMEYSRNAWNLLGATRFGKRGIIRQKTLLVSFCGAVMAILPWIFRGIGIMRAFSMGELLTPATNLPAFAGFPIPIPLVFLIVGMIVLQMLAVVCVGLAVLAVSAWRKNEIQALFFSLLLLVVPLVLKLMGFDFAGCISVAPVYCFGT